MCWISAKCVSRSATAGSRLLLRVVIGLLVLTCEMNLFAAVVWADDWTQWRGNNRDGNWNETGVVNELTAENLKTVWRQPIGSGYSGPTVADGRVYVMDRQEKPEQAESIWCFDAKTGQRLWQHQYPVTYTISYTAGPRASVTIDGGLAFAVGAMGDLNCLNVADGSVAWKKNLNLEFRISETKRMPIWGITPSPLIFGELLILQISGADGAAVVGLDKTTGREVWRALNDAGQYSSPVLTKQAGKDVVICWTGEAIAGLDPTTGQVFWRHPFPPAQMPIGVATPIIKDDQIFVTSFYDGSLMLKMNQQEMSVSEVWSAKGPNERTTQALHSIISTPIWIGDHIYGVDSYGELRCLQASDGARVWESLTAVKKNRWGTIHFVSHSDDVWMFNEQGEIIIGQLTPQALVEKSRVKVIDPTTVQLPDRKRGGVCWSHPAFANRCIFVRNDREIICIDVSQ